MLKKFLKSSVSALVFFAAMSPVDSSWAGNASNGEENPDKKKISIAQKQSKSKGQIFPNFQSYAKGKADDEVMEYLMGNFSIFPNDTMLHTLQYLDPETTLNNRLVCKKWDYLIKGGTNDLARRLNNITEEELENIHPDFLRKLLFHPVTFHQLHDRLSTLYYDKVLKLVITQPSLDLDSLFIPHVIEKYSSIMQQIDDYHPFFSKMCMQFDPCKNPKRVWFTTYITKESKKIQDLFLQIAQQNPFKIKTFPSLINKPNNFPTMQTHLLALKYLGRSNNDFADTQMKKFAEILHNYLLPTMQVCNESIPFIQRDLKKSMKFFHYYTKQPLWSTYMHESLAPFNEQLSQMICIASSTFAKDLNPEKMQDFWNYLDVIGAQLTPEVKDAFHQALAKVYAAQNKTSEQVALLGSLYDEVDKQNLSKIVEKIVEPCMEEGDYNKALVTLDDLLNKVGDSPFRFQILFQKAKSLLGLQDKERFPQVEECLHTISAEFERLNVEEFDTPYAFTSGEGENPQQVNEDYYYIEKDELLILQGILALSKGSYADAYQALTGLAMDRYDFGQIIYGDFEDNYNQFGTIILGALKTQLPNIKNVPNKLINLFGEGLGKEISFKGFSYSVLRTPKGQKLIATYGDVLKFLLKGHFKYHPLDKIEFKQLQKKNSNSAEQNGQLDNSFHKDKKENKHQKDKK